MARKTAGLSHADRLDMSDGSDEIRIEAATPEDVAKYAPSGAGASGSAASPPAEGAPEAETELQKTQRERDEYKDKWLRAKADAQNQLRRLRSEREEAVRVAVADFARAVLNIVDDLERTLQAAEENHDAEHLIEGVRIIRDHLHKVLGEYRIQRIESLGQPFDPLLHRALTQQPSADLPDGTVVQEVQAGYKIEDRVLRPATVIVSCAPSPREPNEGAGQGKDEPAHGE